MFLPFSKFSWKAKSKATVLLLPSKQEKKSGENENSLSGKLVSSEN
jgi:hypothetical protein